MTSDIGCDTVYITQETVLVALADQLRWSRTSGSSLTLLNYVNNKGEVTDLTVDRSGNPYGTLLQQWALFLERVMEDVTLLQHDNVQGDEQDLVRERARALLQKAQESEADFAKQKSTDPPLPREEIDEETKTLILRENRLTERTLKMAAASNTKKNYRSPQTRIDAALREAGPLNRYIHMLKIRPDKLTAVRVVV